MAVGRRGRTSQHFKSCPTNLIPTTLSPLLLHSLPPYSHSSLPCSQIVGRYSRAGGEEAEGAWTRGEGGEEGGEEGGMTGGEEEGEEEEEVEEAEDQEEEAGAERPLVGSVGCVCVCNSSVRTPLYRAALCSLGTGYVQ
ncbi:unnamed protein product [Closterium sp. NIES-65]|nr:unnamed protein product [Closterium sp. NIES-65]